ncbi:MAG: carboxypeptidase regulatory-like domain-containing protein [Candidatus Acidiferrales bacterium]
MKTVARRMLWAFLTVLCATTPLAASTFVIQGVVTDSSGKPIRGAVISAKSGIKTISRFSQKDGKYEIGVASGTYDVTVEAYGFAVKKVSVDTAKAGETNFNLVPANLSLGRLTGSELESLLSDSPETRLLRSHCIECHSLPTVIHRRGQSASDWKDFLPQMTHGATDEPFANATPQELDALSAALEKDFGPSSTYFNLEADASELKAHVKHVEPSDEALRATLIEYDVPTKISRPHSIEIDQRTNVAWFGEESFYGNKAARFNLETEKFQEYPLLTEKARPHTGAVASDGRYWVALAHSNDPAKLASVDPETGEVKQYYWPEKKAPAAHTLTLDHSGNIWFSGGTSGDLWSFDVKKQQFSSHAYPVPAAYPKGTMQDWGEIPGESHPAQGRSYDVTVDNEGMVWFSEIAVGTLVKLNPATGETKDIRPEGTVSIRGITVDPQDNLWFGDFLGHRFGKLNVKTGAVKFYRPPTPNATVYGVTYNQVDGNIWFADMSGNNVTRFDPKTELFTEYPIPQRPDRSYARFIGADVKGRVWFTEYFGDRIGFVDPSGESTGSQITSKRASAQ